LRDHTVAPPELLHNFTSFTRCKMLSEALKEFGQIERTMFSLDQYTSLDLRQRTLRGRHKREARNFLARRVRQRTQ
jgi:TnpA family transposase